MLNWFIRWYLFQRNWICYEKKLCDMKLLTWSEVCETLCFLYFAGIRGLLINCPIDQHYQQLVFQPLQSNILFLPWNFHNLWLIQNRLYRVSQLMTRKSEIYKSMVILWYQEKFEMFDSTLIIFARATNTYS